VARPVYATVAELRAVLPDVAAYPDSKLLMMLYTASELVEVITKQFFAPKRLDFLADGLGNRSVYEAEKNKIIDVESVEIRRGDGSLYPLIGDTYSVGDRRIRLRTLDKDPSPPNRAFLAGSSFYGMAEGSVVSAGSPARRFPYDDKNVRVVGTFGWIERSERFETTLSAPLAAGGTTMSVVDASELVKDDILLIDGAFWVIAGDIAGLDITIDPSPRKADAGASVIRWGQVPLLVREAVLRTAVAGRFDIGSEEEADIDERSRIKKEETDNYKIEFFAGPKSSFASGGTGDPRADAILSRFRAPAVAGEWV
jgi:hypothetical protein